MPVQVTRTRLHDFAEIMRHRCDEADASAGLLRAHIARRATGRVSDRLEREAFAKLCAHLRQRDILIDALAVDFAEWHRFDKVMSIPRPCAHCVNEINSSSFTSFSATALILIVSPASCAASMLRSPREIAEASHEAEFSGIERVERDIDAADPAIGELVRMLASCEPLVVSVSSSSAPTARWRDSARNST